jgi:hypothetical protein
MNEPAGQATAIFAANGVARHRLVRAAIVAGFALLAAWAVALALGVLGGFGSLPLLPSSHPQTSGDATANASRAPHPAPVRLGVRSAPANAAPARSAPARSSAPASSAPTRAPRVRSTTQAGQPTRTAPSVTSSGHAFGTTRPSGKPTGSPGNGPGGGGAPGQLR